MRWTQIYVTENLLITETFKRTFKISLDGKLLLRHVFLIINKEIAQKQQLQKRSKIVKLLKKI